VDSRVGLRLGPEVEGWSGVRSVLDGDIRPIQALDWQFFGFVFCSWLTHRACARLFQLLHGSRHVVFSEAMRSAALCPFQTSKTSGGYS
jgi:hypothetical protein